MKMNENDLVKKLQNPKTESIAFRQLVHLYKEKIYWHARRMVNQHEDANDIVQNVFIKIHKGIKGFNSNSKLYTWIYRITTNESISFIEKQKKHKHSSLEIQKENASSDDPRTEIIIEKLMFALQTLPPKQRAVFNMKYFEEMTYKSMSEILHTSEGALKASYHHAAQKIKQYILDENKLNKHG